MIDDDCYLIYGVTTRNILSALSIDYDMDVMKYKRFLSLGLWLLVAQLCHYVPHVSGQQGKL